MESLYQRKMREIALKDEAVYEIAKANPQMPVINVAILSSLPLDLVLLALKQTREKIPHSAKTKT